MSSITVAKRYAKSIYVVAKELEIQSQILEELRSAREIFSRKSFILFLKAPSISKSNKIEAVTGAIGKFISPISLHFIKLLILNGRIEFITHIVEHYEELMEKDKNLIKIDLRSFYKPDPSFIENIKSFMKTIFNKDIILKVIEDKGTLGGVSLKYRDNFIDYTLRGKMETLRHEMLHSV
ncbi:MAG: ATP synthase F1 subunit delta [Planctomycetes bacterium]|nr:ATP synthase F1 subunit delta [Planctomycetota bacterium]